MQARAVPIVLALLAAAPVSGQAWVPSMGQAFVKVSTQWSSATEQFRADGTRAPYVEGLEVAGFEDRSRYLYAEVGLLRGAAVVLLLPFKDLTVRTPHPQAASGLPGTDRPVESATTGLGRAQVGLRFRLNRAVGLAEGSQHAVALNTSARIPLGVDRDAQPSVAAGQVDVEGTLNYGLSLWPAPVYAQAGVGYRFRTNAFGLSTGDGPKPDYGNEWLVNAEAGVNVGPRFLLQALIFGVFSNQPPEQTFDIENPLPTHQRYLKTGAGVTVYPLSRLGVSLQVFATPSGANTVRSVDWFLGLETRL